MIENFFVRRAVIARLESGPLAAHLPLLASSLRELGYSAKTIRRYLRNADRFGRWLTKAGIALVDAGVEELSAYRRAVASTQHRTGVSGLERVAELLRPAGVLNHTRRTPSADWLGAYDAYLRDVRGLSPSSCEAYLRNAGHLVTELFPHAPPDWTSLTAEQISEWVRRHAEPTATKFRPGGDHARRVALPGFLGRCRANVVASDTVHPAALPRQPAKAIVRRGVATHRRRMHRCRQRIAARSSDRSFAGAPRPPRRRSQAASPRGYRLARRYDRRPPRQSAPGAPPPTSRRRGRTAGGLRSAGAAEERSPRSVPRGGHTSSSVPNLGGHLAADQAIPEQTWNRTSSPGSPSPPSHRGFAVGLPRRFFRGTHNLRVGFSMS